MKKLLYFAFLGVFAFFGCVTADTIDIKWGADNQTYTTTTCTVGGDVILPTPPTKRGYVFRGWQKDVFYRGEWANWANVPSVSSEYPSDYHGNHVPEQNDYMVVADSSEYVSGESPVIFVQTVSTSGADAVIKTTDITGNVYEFHHRTTQTITPIGETGFYVRYLTPVWHITADKPFVVDGIVYFVGNEWVWTYHTTIDKIANDYSVYSGTWRFVYDGDWSTDGKNGWKPVEQIVNE